MTISQEKIVQIDAFTSKEGKEVAFDSIRSTAIAGKHFDENDELNAPTFIDYMIKEPCYFNGVSLILKNHHEDDYIELQALDDELGTITLSKIGTAVPFYPLSKFGRSWQLADDKQQQEPIRTNYSATLMPGMIIRIIYHSFGAQDVRVKANLYIHKMVA